VTTRRSVQLFLHTSDERRRKQTLDMLPAFEAAGCQHVVLGFHQPPTEEQIKRVAP
jgi:hypothetical protein